MTWGRTIGRRALITGAALAAAACARDVPTASGTTAQDSLDVTQTSRPTWAQEDDLLDRATITTRLVPQPVEVLVVLPPGYRSGTGHHPLVLLLHGSQGSARSWLEGGWFREAAAATDAVYVIPDGGSNGWYLDWARESPRTRWQSLHLDVVLPLVEARYRTLRRRESRAVVGISMGGFGAMHYAQARPGLFAAATALSGAVSLRRPRDFVALDAQQVDDKPPYAIFGRDPAARAQAVDPIQHVDALRGTRVRLWCGDGAGDPTETAMLGANRLFLGAARAAGVDCALEVLPGGHGVDVWRPAMEREIPTLMGVLKH